MKKIAALLLQEHESAEDLALEIAKLAFEEFESKTRWVVGVQVPGHRRPIIYGMWDTENQAPRAFERMAAPVGGVVGMPLQVREYADGQQ